MAVSSQSRQSKKDDKVNASVYMDRSLADQIGAVANAPESRYRSKGDVIRHAVRAYLDLD